MPISYEYVNDKNYIISKVIDTITLDEAVRYIDALENDSTINKDFYEIVNFEETRRFAFGYREAHDLLNRFKALGVSKGYLGSLLVAPTPLSSGMSNVIHVIAETYGISIEVFRTIKEAQDYIAEQQQ